MSTFTPTDNSTSSDCISIIIPFYNEEENVETVLQETQITNPGAEIIAVNDGSRDATEALIKKFQDVRLISFSKNLGQSAPLCADGWRWSKRPC
jgi:dolichol-phosphate mannosyltransferase